MKLRDLLGRIKRRQTSLADRDDYLDLCELAGRDPAVFATFKRQTDYVRILEHTTESQGRAYLAIVRERYPHLLEHLDRFRCNDRYGEPRTFEFEGIGAWSPTTLRYIKVLGDLESLFGDLAGFSVAEIGGGYGGQCVILDAYRGFSSYLLVDLEPCLGLARAYLEHFELERVDLRTMEQLPAAGRFDLVISNYAWSECTRPVQNIYLDRVLKHARRGYLTCNEVNPDRFESYRREELVEHLPSARLLPEQPSTYEGNYVLVWGDDARSRPEAAG